MRRLYASPLRVYLCLAVLALAGIYSGMRLPVSLFPNSSKPKVGVSISYGSETAEDFFNTYGQYLEGQLAGISTDNIQVEKLTSNYGKGDVNYTVEFKWGAPPKEALKETRMVVDAFSSRLPQEVRDSVGIWTSSHNSGFLAISFYSARRGLDEVYDILDPLLATRLAKVQDANNPGLWNPEAKEIRVEMIPEKAAALALFPRDIDKAVESAILSYGGGTVSVGLNQLSVQMPRAFTSLEDFGRILVPTPAGKVIHLGDVARIDFGPKTSGNQSFKTNGAPSIILWATPRPGGNVKRMAEDILGTVREVMLKVPSDIQYRVLVDPSEFIRSAVENVFHEVLIGAMLAVLILSLFIGSIKNTITAAIEIPLSMVLAFILMRISGMNLNLISLGGLALSAGMNVDASVVVMENIFRHFEEVPEGLKGALDYRARLKILCEAVAEVRFPVIASTVASLVVFLPLAFTSDLSYAILGDLAKTVVFSHGFSAFVALILVPTVRLQLMSRNGGKEKPHRSPIESQLKRLESLYALWLGRFISSARAKRTAYLGVAAALVLLLTLALPHLPKEIVGKPDTDWMDIDVSTRGNTMLKQMESQASEIEADLLKAFGDRIQYTFTQVYGLNGAEIMAKLKSKKEMPELWKRIQEHFPNTPETSFWVEPWNPSELPIPDMPPLKIAVHGGEADDRAFAADAIRDLIQDHKVFPRVHTDPQVGHEESVTLRPNLDLWPALAAQGVQFLPSDLTDLTRVATDGRRVGHFPFEGKDTDIFLRFPHGYVSSPEDIAGLPISVGSKLVPLGALARVGIEQVPPARYREDQRSVAFVYGREDKGDEWKAPAAVEQAKKLVNDWVTRRGATDSTGKAYPIVTFEDGEKEMHDALRQLGTAVGLSILLIFLTLVVQFGSFVNSLLVMVAIPLGLVGVLVSLVVFRSTLSLNSVLGIILLNGIAVANSILLVDFLNRLVERGMAPAQAALEAGKKRLRPILITSLTTILGMLPIAAGMGDGGKVLQPLGIAVSGGLWVSMGFTLFIVPALQVSYLNWIQARRVRKTLASSTMLDDALSEGNEGIAPGFTLPSPPAANEITRRPELLQ